MDRRVLVCAVAAGLALAVACGKSKQSPTSPSATSGVADTGAAADGSTLKVTAPVPVSPVNGAQPDGALTLVATKSTGKFADVTPLYEFQIRSTDNTVVFDSGVVGGAGSGPNNVQFTPAVALIPDTLYTWRARASYGGKYGPWSSDASFKSAVGGYLRDGELYDPLTNGKTVGEPFGVTFTSDGASINDLTSMIRYNIGTPVTTGEFSFMAKNIKNAAPGGKTKMMAIQQGFADITDNPYRFTIEKRGSGYSSPGQTRYRIITNGSVFDSASTVPNYDVNRWYFWKATWTNGSVRVTVQADSETGPTIVNLGVGTSGKPYQPNPMVAYVGAPVGRAGPDDASVPRIVVKNVWLSRNPRPLFPQ